MCNRAHRLIVVSPMPSPVSAARSTTPACPPHRAFASTTAPGRADGMTDPTIFGHVNLSFSRGRAVVTLSYRKMDVMLEEMTRV